MKFKNVCSVNNNLAYSITPFTEYLNGYAAYGGQGISVVKVGRIAIMRIVLDIQNATSLFSYTQIAKIPDNCKPSISIAGTVMLNDGASKSVGVEGDYIIVGDLGFNNVHWAIGTIVYFTI